MKEDKDILDAIQAGRHEEAFQFLYRHTLRKVLHYVKKNSGSQEQGEDIFQDGVVILFEKVKQGTFSTSSSVEGFVYSVCRNLWIDRKRREQRHKTFEQVKMNENQLHENQLDGIISREKDAAMSELFSQLNEQCQKLLRLFLFEKKTMKEISELLGLKNEKVAKAKNYRCKQYLVEVGKKNQDLIQTLQD